MMLENVNVLLFDFTRENLDEHEEAKVNLTSGKNVLEDLIQFEDGEFCESPFVQCIQIPTDDPYNQIPDEQMSDILGIEKNNLLYYRIFITSFKKSYSFTHGYLDEGARDIKILANKKMIEENFPIFEIRYKVGEKWSSWQAIAGKFIVAHDYRFGPGGVREVYSSITEREISIIKQNFQIRYSGNTVNEILEPNTLYRIINDPFDSVIRKIIDPSTFQILFDSQLIQEVSSEKSFVIWRKFEERYR